MVFRLNPYHACVSKKKSTQRYGSRLGSRLGSWSSEFEAGPGPIAWRWLDRGSMVNPDNWALDFGLYFHLSPGCSDGMLAGVCSWVGKSPPKNAYKYNMEYCLWCSANDVLYGYITYIHMINYRCDGCKYICLCSLHAWIHMSLKSSPCKCSPTASSSFENGRSAVPFDRSLLDSDLASVGPWVCCQMGRKNPGIFCISQNNIKQELLIMINL